jgi:LemA protein
MEIFLGISVALVLAVALMYNSLIAKKNQVDNLFASVDAMLKQRYDLIPNLIASVQEYMEHEKETLEEISALRSQALRQKEGSDTLLENKLSGALSSLMIAVENYPNLKANENFIHLQHSLYELEEQIAASRRAYNQSVTDFNNAIEMFPSNFVAGFMHLSRKNTLEIPSHERQNVDVKRVFKP